MCHLLLLLNVVVVFLLLLVLLLLSLLLLFFFFDIDNIDQSVIIRFDLILFDLPSAVLSVLILSAFFARNVCMCELSFLLKDFLFW